MNTFYTILFVAALFAIAIPVGNRIYPNVSSDAYPAWVYKMPNALLGVIGTIVLIFGLVATWVSGQVLFSFESLTMDLWIPLIGLVAGVLIALHGASFFGVILLKKSPKAKTK